MIPEFQKAGINRFWIGIQSLNAQQLNKFNRSGFTHDNVDKNNLHNYSKGPNR